MAASEASGQWESALAILAKMQDHGPQPNLVALNAAASALLNCGRLAEALALYREAEDNGLNAQWLDTGRFPSADLDLHCFPVELAKLAVMRQLLDLALQGPRSSGLLLVTGAGRHGGRPVLAPRLRPWLEELGLPVEDGDWFGTTGRLFLSETALEELTCP
ncbi:Pentatricopeptide repeat-containing protein [Durusdinium trenchii]|uniref:Chloroplastic n=1 Tax=Durusdinium trenchii TaxID=1381693 RepID=A0ABP0RQ61_9DINO